MAGWKQFYPAARQPHRIKAVKTIFYPTTGANIRRNTHVFMIPSFRNQNVYLLSPDGRWLRVQLPAPEVNVSISLCVFVCFIKCNCCGHFSWVSACVGGWVCLCVICLLSLNAARCPLGTFCHLTKDLRVENKPTGTQL